MPTDATLLGEVPLFKLLSQAERAELAGQLEAVNFPVGKTIFNYGDPGDSLFIIRSGEVEIFFKDDTGAHVLLEMAGPGEVFGELSLLDQGPRSASVVVNQEL